MLVALILLLPILGTAVNGLLGLFVPAYRRHETLIGGLATAAVAVPFLISVYLFAGFEETRIVTLFTWMAADNLQIDWAFRIDPLSLVMAMVVTGVGGVIHLYSIGYMHGDDGYWRYFAYLNLFIFAMLNLVLSNNLVGLFLGWEGVGLCSYLLIGFWYADLSKSAAAMKAFIVNRIGDFAFLIGIFLLFRELGALDFDTVNGAAGTLAPALVTWVILLFFIGATGKSAQIPLFVWLPDAMAGPTPVSALIHAATMVTSGLYLLARLSPLVLAAPGAMAVIAVVGAVTALVAATIAITQYDIKRVLAYSTVSQLGFMFMAAGVGAFFVAIFHVMTHAFFKACLFLGSGSVIHGMHHVEHELEHRGHGKKIDPQDMRTMGNLRRYLPSTHKTFLMATLAISGIPLFSGFFSKDEILFKAFEYGYAGNTYAWFVWAVGIGTALLTAIYMMRAYVLTFRGKERWPDAAHLHPHESPATMTIPLWILGILSVVGGFVGLPGVIAHGDWNLIHHFLGSPYGGPVAEPYLPPHASGFLLIEWLLILLGSTIAVVGVALGWRWYDRHGLAFDDRLKRSLGGLYTLFAGKYFLDELYDKTVVKPVINGLARGSARFDEKVIDGAVNGLARTLSTAGQAFRHIQTGVVQSYALAIVLGVVIVIGIILLGF